MKPQRILAPLLIVLAILALLLVALARVPLVEARSEWRAGKNAEAISIAERWSELHLWPSAYHQMIAAAYLTAGNEAAAKPHLASIDHPLIPAVSKVEVAQHLFARARYADFLAYDAASHDDAPEALLYRAAAQAALSQISAAEATLRSINPSTVDAKKLAALRTALDQRKNGSAPYVLDRGNNVIAVYRADRNEVSATDRDFDGIIDRDAGALTIGAHLAQLGTTSTIATTLDPFVQKAAMAALAGYRGSLVAIDPKTNEILAIANSKGKGALQDLALEREYEPGSVVKVLTGLNALSSGIDVDALFPYTCKGFLMIDGRHFGDWVPQGHGKLNSIDDALAVSCNVFFADLGLRLGREKQHRFLHSAGFDGQVDLGIFQVPLGRSVGQVFNNF